MRPTGRLHLGHLHGVLKNWIVLQHQYECFFFVADWQALTTHYNDPKILAEVSRNLGEPMVGRNVSTMPDVDRIAGRGW